MGKLKRLSSVFFALLIVTSAVGGPVGTAAAASNPFQDCHWTDSAIGAFFDGVMNPNEDGECRFNPQDDGADLDQTRTDLYESSVTQKQMEDAMYTSSANRLNDTETVAGMKGKIAVWHAIKAGENKSTAKKWARENVSDYYAQIEVNQIRQWESTQAHAEYIIEGERSSTGSMGTWIHADGVVTGSNGFTNFTNVTVTLVNGTDVTYTTWKYEDSNAPDGERMVIATNKSRTNTSEVSDYTDNTASWNVSDGSGNIVHIGESYEIQSLTTDTNANNYDIESQHSRVTDNLGPYVDGIYNNNPQPSELNVSDVLGPDTIYSEASTERSSTGYYGWTAIQLSSMGYNGTVNASHEVTVYNNTDGNFTTFNGTLFYTADDVSQFKTGTTYNFSNLKGTVLMAVQEDNRTLVRDLEKDGTEFTIDSATDTETGESLNATKLNPKVYSGYNTSSYKEEIDRLIGLRDYYEKQKGDAAGGSSTNSGVGLEFVAIAALAGALYAMKQQ